jgi:hypothetical protein
MKIRIIIIFKIIFGAILVSPAFLYSYPYVSDWNIFYQAATGVTDIPYHNPFWTEVLIQPFLLLGSKWGYCLMMGMITSSTLVISQIYTGKYTSGAMALISVPFLRLIIHGQGLELFPLWGVFCSGLIAPVFLMVKPQTAAVTLAGRKFAPLQVILGIVLAGYVFMTVDTSNVNMLNQNISIFPYGLIVGIPLLVVSFVKNDNLMAASSAFFVAPYMITHSLFVSMFAAYLRWGKLKYIIWIFIWVFFVI